MEKYRGHTLNRITRLARKTSVQIVLFLLVLLLARAYVQRDAVSGDAPGIAGMQLDGKPFNLQQYRGRPVLVHFWASWCGICRMEESSLAAISKDHAVITIAMQSGSESEVRAYLEKQKLVLPVLLDEHGEMAGRYGARAVPASFILDGNGRIRFVEFGYTTELGLRARLWLAALLY